MSGIDWESLKDEALELLLGTLIIMGVGTLVGLAFALYAAIVTGTL